MKYLNFSNEAFHSIKNWKAISIWLYSCSIDKNFTLEDLARHFSKKSNFIKQQIKHLIEINLIYKVNEKYYKANSEFYFHSDHPEYLLE